jgi:hypothetical protein
MASFGFSKISEEKEKLKKKMEEDFQKELEIATRKHHMQLQGINRNTIILGDQRRVWIRQTEEQTERREYQIRMLTEQNEETFEQKRKLEENMAQIKDQNRKKKGVILLILVSSAFLLMSVLAHNWKLIKEIEQKAVEDQKELNRSNDKYENLWMQMSEKESEYRQLIEQKDKDNLKSIQQREKELTELFQEDFENKVKKRTSSKILEDNQNSIPFAKLFWRIVITIG